MKKLIFIILILFVSVVDADIPNLQFIDMPSFAGGLNTRDGAGGVEDNELTESVNCFLDAKGIVKRNGYTRYTGYKRIAGTSQGTGIYLAHFTAGDKIIGTAGTEINYKSGDSTWVDITGSVTLTADTNILFTMVNNVMVGVNGTNPAFYYTGTGTATTLSGTNIPTAPTSCETFHGRLFLSQGRRLYWSRYMADWQEFHPDDWQDFEEPIIGLKVLGDVNNSMLIVLCKSSIHYLAFDPSLGATIGGRGTFRVDVISKKHGCISPYSIQECLTPDGQLILIWADNDGLKMLTSGLTIIKITDKIDPTWETLTPAKLQYSIGVHYKPKRWYVFVCEANSAGGNNQVIIYDLRNWAISGLFDWEISSLGILKVGGADLLVGTDYSGYWYQYDNSYNDAGAAIDAYFITKSYDGGQPLYSKLFKSVNLQYIYYGNYDLTIDAYYEFAIDTYTVTHTSSSSYAVFDEFYLDNSVLAGTPGSTDLVITGEEIKGEGRMIRLKVRNNSADEPFKIYSIGSTYIPGRQIILK